MRQTEQIVHLLGQEVVNKLTAARLLVIGAGGIGCELLKDLCMTGFTHITAVDLDTIDLSNLNRQFLFQRQHIRQPKSQVAIGAIRQFNPGIHTKFYQANIKDPQFDVDWFGQFDLVLNALDNLDARRHVNRMCLASHLPLIESGTAGYLGQVTTIRGGETECFECLPKPIEQKQYPVCTIRSTPSEPIHCVVWAKDYLLAQLFDRQNAADSMEDTGDGEELEKLKEEEAALTRITKDVGKPEFAQRVFERVFTEDIQRLLGMAEMWKHRSKPHALSYKELSQTKPDTDGFDPAQPDEHKLMEVEQAFWLFTDSIERLGRRHSQSQALVFDKDDDDTLQFVAATASLRSHVFGIPQQSIFECKAMAGNIVPAISTTNAIVAGMMVMQAVSVLAGRMEDCHTGYVMYGSNRKKTIMREPLARPHGGCQICRQRYLTLRIGNCSITTLREVLDRLEHLIGGEVSVAEGSRLLYDPDYQDNLDRPLEGLGLGTGRMVCVASEDDPEAIPIVLSIARSSSQEMELEGMDKIPVFETPLPAKSSAEEEGDSDDLQVVDNSVVVIDDELSKRKVSEAFTESDGLTCKRQAH